MKNESAVRGAAQGLSLLLFYGVLVGELMLRVGSPNLSEQAVLAFYPEPGWTAGSTRVASLVLVGLLTVIFVEPRTEWWTGGDELGAIGNQC